MKVWAVITADGLDQCCYSEAEAKREVKDLKRMGFEEAKVKRFENEDEAEAWHAKRR
jgi:hypothetical protein